MSYQVGKRPMIGSHGGARALPSTVGKRTQVERLGVPAVPAPRSEPGRPLPPEVRTEMEHRFGADFSAVRVHEGPQAPAIGAVAYTQGSDVHFAPGRYDPTSLAGRRVLAHELAHVVQQQQGRVAPATGGDALRCDPALEAEAEAWAGRIETTAPAPEAAAATSRPPPAPEHAPVQRLQTVDDLDVTIVDPEHPDQVIVMGHDFADLQHREAGLREEYGISARKSSMPRAEGPNNVVAEMRIVVVNGDGETRQIVARFVDQEGGDHLVFRSRFDRGLVTRSDGETATPGGGDASALDLDAAGPDDLDAGYPEKGADVDVDASGISSADAAASEPASAGSRRSAPRELVPRRTMVPVPTGGASDAAAAASEAFVPVGAASWYDPEAPPSFADYQRRHDHAYRESLGVTSASPMAFHHSEQTFFKMLNEQPQVVLQALRAAELAEVGAQVHDIAAARRAARQAGEAGEAGPALSKAPSFFDRGPLRLLAISLDLFTTRASCDHCQTASKALFDEGQFFARAVAELTRMQEDDAPSSGAAAPDRDPMAPRDRRTYLVDPENLRRIVRMDADFFHTDLEVEDGPVYDDGVRKVLHGVPGSERRASEGNRGVIRVAVPVNVNWDVAVIESAAHEPNRMKTMARELMSLSQPSQKRARSGGTGEDEKRAGVLQKYWEDKENAAELVHLAYYVCALDEESQPDALVQQLWEHTSELLGRDAERFARAVLARHRLLGLSLDDAQRALAKTCKLDEATLAELVERVRERVVQDALDTITDGAAQHVRHARPGYPVTEDELVAAMYDDAFPPGLPALLDDLEAFGVSLDQLREEAAQGAGAVIAQMKREEAEALQDKVNEMFEQIVEWVGSHLIFTMNEDALSKADELRDRIEELIARNIGAQPDIVRFGIAVKPFLDRLDRHALAVIERIQRDVERERRKNADPAGFRGTATKQHAKLSSEENELLSRPISLIKKCPWYAEAICKAFRPMPPPPPARGDRPSRAGRDLHAPEPLPSDPSIVRWAGLRQKESECGFLAAYHAIQLAQHGGRALGRALADRDAFQSAFPAPQNWIADDQVQGLLDGKRADDVLLISSISDLASQLDLWTQDPSAAPDHAGNLGRGYLAAWEFLTDARPSLTCIINTNAGRADLDQRTRGFHYIAVRLERAGAGMNASYVDSLVHGRWPELIDQLRSAFVAHDAPAADAPLSDGAGHAT